jgi:hypothetical protein
MVYIHENSTHYRRQSAYYLAVAAYQQPYDKNSQRTVYEQVEKHLQSFLTVKNLYS